MDKREIIRLLNSEEFRMGKGGLGGLLAVWGLIGAIRGNGGIKRMLLGGFLAASAAADLCPTNLALGYPLDGRDARAHLDALEAEEGWEVLETESA
ncbi:MAG: hypothetical protein Q4G64_10405 [bacterium]|nr:hypothetical protein [bacterium]